MFNGRRYIYIISSDNNTAMLRLRAFSQDTLDSCASSALCISPIKLFNITGSAAQLLSRDLDTGARKRERRHVYMYIRTPALTRSSVRSLHACRSARECVASVNWAPGIETGRAHMAHTARNKGEIQCRRVWLFRGATRAARVSRRRPHIVRTFALANYSSGTGLRD